MADRRRDAVAVLIVGAGPAGLMTAVTLARHGVGCLLVERRREPSGLPRATAVSLRSMELLRAWGLEDRLRAGGVDVDWAMWRCPTLARAADGEAVGIGLPTRAQSAVISPTAPACVPQDHLEPVLLRDLRSFPHAHVALGTEAVSVTGGAGDQRVVLRDGDGRARTVHARYLVAADGAHSPLRRALGIGMVGPEHLAEAVSALFHAPLWSVLGERRHGLYAITHPEADGVFLPAGPGDRWCYGTLTGPERGGAGAATATETALVARIRAGAGVARLAPRLARIGRFRFAAQVAEAYRAGDAFLVGDAAHRATPRGGTGMNTAIHDGYDLGWKLAWVLRGWSGPALLDSYEAERRPVAAHNVARSADPAGSVASVDDELHADLGGRIAHVWVRPSVSTLDLLGPGLTRFAGPRWDGPTDAGTGAGAGAPPVTLRRLDALPARALGLRADASLLVRPDGVPAHGGVTHAVAQAC